MIIVTSKVVLLIVGCLGYHIKDHEVHNMGTVGAEEIDISRQNYL